MIKLLTEHYESIVLITKQKVGKITRLWLLFILVGKLVYAQNPAAPYACPTYVNPCATLGPSTNDIVNVVKTISNYPLGKNIHNVNSGCSNVIPGAGGNYNYTLYPPTEGKYLQLRRGDQFKITVGAGKTFSQGYRVWVDWNQNNTFTNGATPAPNNELVFQSSTTLVATGCNDTTSAGAVQTSGWITVPMTAACGWTRIRVRSVFANTNFTPIDNQNYGETEDYLFNILDNPVTPEPVLSFLDSSICVGKDITLFATSSGTINYYNKLSSNTPLSNSGAINIAAGAITFLSLMHDTMVYVENVENGCKSKRIPVSINTQTIANVEIIPNDTSICLGDTVVLEARVDTTSISSVYKKFGEIVPNAYQTIADDAGNNGAHCGTQRERVVEVNNVRPLTLVAGTLTEVGVRIKHKRIKDIAVSLYAPNGSKINLSNANGSNSIVTAGANYGAGNSAATYTYLVFTDTAAVSISTVNTSNITGYKKPLQPLSTLTGPSNGYWKIVVKDINAPITAGTDDDGKLLGWYVKFKRDNFADTTISWSPTTNNSAFAPVTTWEETLKRFAYPTTDTDFIFELTNTAGCRKTDTSHVHVNQQLALSTSSTPNQICVGDQAVLHCTSSAAAIDTTYWSSNFAPTFGGNFTVNPTTTTNYTVIAKSTLGCIDTAYYTLTVNPNPAAPVLAASGPTTFCQGNSVTLSTNYTSGLAWSTGSSANTITVSSTIPNITAIYTDANGCSSVASTPMNVVVNPLPTTPVIIPAGPTSFCNGDDVTLSAPAGYTYNWSHDGVAGFSSLQNIVVTTGNNYSVLITDGNGCTAQSANTPITIYPLPPAPILTPQNPTSFCPGGYVTLQSSPSVHYNWTPTALDQQNNTVALGGDYSLTVTDANGCTSASSNIITVTIFPVPPVPVITPDGPLAFCIGNDVTLTAPSSTTYLWSPTGSTSQSITVNTSGNYSVQVTNSSGCSSVFSSSANVVVNPLPQMPILAPLTPTTICAGNYASISAGNYASYLWSDGSTTNPAMFNASGAYSVIVTDNNGCTSPSSLPINITVNPLPPTPGLVANGPTTFCVFDSVGLVASSTIPNPIYYWRPSQDTTINNTFYVNQTDQYNVSVIDNNGCMSPASASIAVTVRPLPTPPQIISSGATTFCEGDSVTLSLSTDDNPTWSIGSADSSIVIHQSGTYSALVTDYCDIVHNPSITINVKQMPIADFAINDTLGCIPLEISFTNKSLYADSYVWNLSTNEILTDTNPTYVFTEPRSYSIILTANSVNGCSNTVSYYNLIKASKRPKMDFDFTPNPALTSTPLVHFYSTTVGADKIYWICNDYNFTDSIYKTSLAMPDTGVHEMTLVAMTADGCIDSLTRPIRVEGDFLLYVPNAFTPSNQDGLNDKFIPVTEYMDYKTFTMRIFDRWGNEIYFTDDAKKGWDGLVRGERILGTYNWTIDCLDTRGVTHSKAGTVTVVN